MSKFYNRIENLMFWLSNQDRLFNAIGHGDRERIKQLLSTGVNPNCVNSNGLTPIIKASIAGKTGPLEELLRHNANLNALDGKDRNSIIHASRNGHSDIVNMLLLVNPNLNARDVDGLSATNYAELNGYEKIKENLNDAGANNNMPLHKLFQDKKIEIDVTGKNIETVDLKVKNTSGKNLDIAVPKGTSFKDFHVADKSTMVGGIGDYQPYQEMVVTEEETFSLRNREEFNAKLNVACLDPEKKIPDSRSHSNFASMADTEIVRILNRMSGEDTHTKQAAIWACSSKYSKEEIFQRLRNANTGRSAFTQDNINFAKKILDELGIENFL